MFDVLPQSQLKLRRKKKNKIIKIMRYQISKDHRYDFLCLTLSIINEFQKAHHIGLYLLLVSLPRPVSSFL